MKSSKKSKQIMLLIILISIIAVVIFYGKSNTSNNGLNEIEKGGSDTVLDDKAETYYKENFLHEYAINSILGDDIYNYKGSPVQLIMDSDGVKIVDISDDETISKITFNGNNEFLSKCAYCIDEDLSIHTVMYDEKDNKVVVEKFDSKGNKTDVSIVLKDFQGSVFNKGKASYIAVDKLMTDENYIYLLSNVYKTIPTLQVFKMNGELHATYETLDGFDIDKKGNLYIAHGTDNYGFRGFDKINVETKEVIYTSLAFSADIAYNEKGNYIYLMDKDKMSKYSAEDGKFIEDAFAFGVDSSFLVEDRIASFFVDDEYGLFFNCIDNSSSNNKPYKIYKYDLIEGIRPEKQITLTVTSPYKQDFLAEAIVRYELKYPEQKIKYDYEYMSRNEFYNYESTYAGKLTTKILANDIGDIVLTGGSSLIFRNIFETDAFMDLSELIKNDKNYDDLNKAALEGITIDNAIRGLPVSLIYLFFEVNTALLDKMNVELDYENLKWSDVLDLLSIIEKKAPDSYLFITYNDDDFESYILEPMLGANMPDLIDLENKKVDLNKEWFINLLEQLKKALSSKNFAQKNASYSVIDEIHDALFNYRANIDVVRKDLFGRYYMYNQKDKRSKYIPLFKGEKSNNIVAKSINMYSINNRSENKENAWKFLSFLLEEELQSLKKIPGTALNLEAEKKVSEKIEKVENRYEKGINGIWEMMEPIYKNIDYMYDLNYFKNDIKAPILEYLQDKISLEEAIKKAEDNVWIRLNE